MIEFTTDNASMRSITDDINRLKASGKKSIRSATEWAAHTIIKSLGVQTKVSKKRRDIITKTITGGGQNAYGKRVKGGSVRLRGVMMWRYRGGKKVEEFTPIDLDKDVPVVHFVGKNGNRLVRLVKTGKIITQSKFEAMSNLNLAKNSYLRFIRLSGLAKKSWTWMQKRVKRGGEVTGRQGGKGMNVGALTWVGPNLIIHNRLEYIRDALTSGDSSVNTALRNGAESFKFKVDKLLGVERIKTQ